MFNKIVKFIGDIAMLWWTSWSNFRYRKTVKFYDVIAEEDKANSLAAIKLIARNIYKKFKYKNDTRADLYDAIVPPTQNYINYTNGIVEDDCDGFHSTLYYCLAKSDIECYLLTANTLGSGHCILLFSYKNEWYIDDYTTLYGGYAHAEVAIESYNKTYEKKYDGKVIYNGLVKYNFTTGNWEVANIKNLDED